MLPSLQVAPNCSAFAPGWQLACSGRYTLDLSRQAHRWFAMQLVELGQQQSRAVDVMSTFYRPGSDWQTGRRRQRVAAPSSAASSPAPAGAAEAGGGVGKKERGGIFTLHVQPLEGTWVRLGDCRSRMLHVVYDGERLDEQVVRDPRRVGVAGPCIFTIAGS